MTWPKSILRTNGKKNKEPFVLIKPHILFFYHNKTYHKNFACEKRNDILNYTFVEHVGRLYVTLSSLVRKSSLIKRKYLHLLNFLLS